MTLYCNSFGVSILFAAGFILCICVESFSMNWSAFLDFEMESFDLLHLFTCTRSIALALALACGLFLFRDVRSGFV